MNVNRDQILTAILAVLILLSAFQTFQLKELSGKIKGTAAGTGSSQGETYEQMIERMHGSSSGSQPSAAPTSSIPADTGMVGGC